jgi:N-acetylglutamate synthase-like GNAT family acetyltransferase
MSAVQKIKVRRATTSDLPVMQELVTYAYIQKGYLTPLGDKITYPDLQDKRHVALVATHLNQVVGTITISFGGPNDLPISDEFPEEIHEAWNHAKQGHLAYVGRLAVLEGFLGERVTPLLFRSVALYCLLRRVKAVLCIINPKHEDFYTHRGFESISVRNSTEGLLNAPAAFLAFYREKVSFFSILNEWILVRASTKMRCYMFNVAFGY